jgi:hypothetical protein
MSATFDLTDLRVEPAICETGADRRASARRLGIGHLAPDQELLRAAQSIADRCPPMPGRVHGLGEFVDRRVHAALAATLRPEHRLRLRDRFEWYACRGAGFHTDAHYAGVLFGAWCVAGPPREIVFARAGLRAPSAIGDFAVFDPFEPHAVLDPGQPRYDRDHFSAAAPSVFIGFEIELDAEARRLFGVGDAPATGATLSSSVAVNAETSALPTGRSPG